MIGKFVRLAAPAEPPVTLEDARLWCRVEAGLEDGLLQGLLAAAYREVERCTYRGCGVATWRGEWPRFPAAGPQNPDAALRLWPVPLVQVLQVEWLDASQAWQLLPAGGYQVDAGSGLSGRLLPAIGAGWPSALAGAAAAVRVTFRAGEQPLAEDLALCVRQLVAHWYREREAVGGGGQQVVPMACRQLLLNASAGEYL